MKTSQENSLRFLLEVYSFLSLPFLEQISKRGKLGNGLTDDIAEDCLYSYLSYFFDILEENGKDVNQLRVLAKEISEVFSMKSRGSPSYDDEFWTLQSLNKSQIWDEQRKRASDMIDILKKM